LKRIDPFPDRERQAASPSILNIAEAGKESCFRKPEIQRYNPRGLYLFLLLDISILGRGL